ncbi:DUF3817 domain-containing protein [Aridibaculum aurantiacum]|uniref:DUF3817 domain-containing protein n=1 Tax=Aridibaculum aurantiacum TaxID=2810307 RepID=UPI001A965D4C|nr:DUF3817 domain-containing protein [Aridibaculum aurantiacum]
MNLSTAIGRLRLTGIAEGISLLVLLFIAMPLKYLADMPLMVKWVGWAHGVLFIAFIAAAFFVYLQKKISFKMVAIAFVAAFLPFGTFWFDKQIKDVK